MAKTTLKGLHPALLLPQLLETIRRFPLSVACASGALIVSWIAIGASNADPYLRFIMTGVLGLFVFTVCSLVSESQTPRFRLSIFAIATVWLGGYCLLLPADIEAFGEKTITNFLFLCLVALTALTWAPFWKTSTNFPSENQLWEWNRRLLLNLLTSIFGGVLIFAGIALALLAVDALFSVTINTNTYIRLWVTVAVFIGPIHFLHELPKNTQGIEIVEPPPKIMAILTRMILTPLSLVYFVILYLYSLSVIVNQNWPVNLLSWLVIGFSFIAIATYFLWTPFRTQSWERRQKLFWLLLLPQIVMLFLAISSRIQDFGWTENRYYVVLLGVYLAAVSLFHCVGKEVRFTRIFISLSVTIAISQLPLIGGYAIGINSQLHRLESMLAESELWNGENIQKDGEELSLSERAEISSQIEYLVNRGGVSVLQPLFAQATPEMTMQEYYQNRSAVTQVLGFDFTWPLPQMVDTDSAFYRIKEDSVRNISGYRLMRPLNSHRLPTTLAMEQKAIEITFNRESGDLIIDNFSMGLPGLLESLNPPVDYSNLGEVDVAEFTVSADRYTLIVTSLQSYRGLVTGFEGELLVR